MTNKEIGEMIKIRRLSRGMTQDQLAVAIGCSPSAIGMYESGRRRPKDNVAEALADVFNVPKWSILYSEDEVQPIQEAMSDDELWQIREDFRRNPELRTLHSLQRGASKDELKQIEQYVRFVRHSNDHDETDAP